MHAVITHLQRQMLPRWPLQLQLLVLLHRPLASVQPRCLALPGRSVLMWPPHWSVASHSCRL